MDAKQEKALRELNELMSKEKLNFFNAKNKEIGELAFKYHDTYGLPTDTVWEHIHEIFGKDINATIQLMWEQQCIEAGIWSEEKGLDLKKHWASTITLEGLRKEHAEIQERINNQGANHES